MLASGVPLKLSGEEPASIGDVTLCDDTPIKRSGVVSAGAATGRTGRTGRRASRWGRSAT